MSAASLTTTHYNEDTHRHEKVDVILSVGDGVSYAIGSDAYPMTIRRVSPSGKTVWCSRDKFRGMPGANSYADANKKGVFIPQDEDPENWDKFTKRADGKFRPVGSKCGYLFVGRTFCQDPHF